MQSALAFAHDRSDDFVAELINFLRIPSISTDAANEGDVRMAADWLSSEFHRIGMQKVNIVETGGHPVVTAEYHIADDRPTLLIYGHYDVQPPDPLDLWETAPFEPVVRNGDLYARGSCDDKGQLYMHVKAVESYLGTGENLPVNVKFIVEGEEENGSVHLRSFLEKHASELGADVVLISDTAMFGEGIPSVTYGLRGLAYIQVELRGPNRDLHSGVYGGAVENPLNVLSSLVAGLHDEAHRITIPGFYENVRELTTEERSEIRGLPFDKSAWLEAVGVSSPRTEKGFSILESIWARPSLDVNGIWGGYQGPGAKTVLPAVAGAKISMRLVPDQRPDEVVAKIKRYFDANTPDTMQLSFRDLHGGHAVVVDRDIPAMKAASRALRDEFGRDPAFIREGGSIPVVADFKQVLGLDTVLMGFGLNSDAIHSPNEHFGLDRFHKGIASSIRFLDAFARLA